MDIVAQCRKELAKEVRPWFDPKKINGPRFSGFKNAYLQKVKIEEEEFPGAGPRKYTEAKDILFFLNLGLILSTVVQLAISFFFPDFRDFPPVLNIQIIVAVLMLVLFYGATLSVLWAIFGAVVPVSLVILLFVFLQNRIMPLIILLSLCLVFRCVSKNLENKEYKDYRRYANELEAWKVDREKRLNEAVDNYVNEYNKLLADTIQRMGKITQLYVGRADLLNDEESARKCADYWKLCIEILASDITNEISLTLIKWSFTVKDVMESEALCLWSEMDDEVLVQMLKRIIEPKAQYQWSKMEAETVLQELERMTEFTE